MFCVYNSRTKGEGCGHVVSIEAPPPPSPTPSHQPVIFWLIVPKRCFCYGLLYLSLYVFACMSWWNIFLDSRLAIFGGRNCSFGYLLVVFWLWCRYFKCVLLSFRFLGTEGVRWLYRILIIAFLSIYERRVHSAYMGQFLNILILLQLNFNDSNTDDVNRGSFSRFSGNDPIADENKSLGIF